MQTPAPDTTSLEEKKVPVKKVFNQIPEDIINNVELNAAIKVLPPNYNFEIHKTVWKIRELKKTLNKDKLTVSLQFPEGFLLFACLISDIFEHFTGCECIIMGDTTFGACCVDDITADELDSDFIIHYGHSCLIPIDETCVKSMYVFVEIAIDVDHFLATLELNFPNKDQSLIIMGTIQFNTALFTLRTKLEEKGYRKLIVPQEKPRSSGEVLGCTAPPLKKEDLPEGSVVIFLCDGRFHMEAAMIANPTLKFYQYNPYNKVFSIEEYAHEKMLTTRKQEIERFTNIKRVGIILGVLGRQGSPKILEKIEATLKEANIPYIVLLVSEIYDSQLMLFKDEVDVWVQIACPRISIDWGTFFTKPLITPYEFFVAMKKTQWKEVYPMDYYSNTGGEWTNYHHKQGAKKPARKNIVVQYEAKKE